MAGSNDQPEKKSSRRLLLKAAASHPIVVLLLGYALGTQSNVYVTERTRERHSLSVSIYRSDNGVPESKSTLDELAIFAGEQPIATPGIPATEFSYTGVVRNDGDYTEEDLLVQAVIVAENGSTDPIYGLTVDSSSQLLRDSISIERLPNDRWHYQFAVPRLTPDEWFSISTTWSSSAEMRVEARSSDVAEVGSV